MSKNKISKNWINRQRRDIYIRQSKIEGYRSRAAYKLIEIDKKFKILKNGISLIDLGAAPGGWSQYAATRVKSGKILSIDLKKMEKISNTAQIIGDFTEPNCQNQIKEYFKSKVDVVVSDMAANTTGNKNIDSISSGELCKEAIFFAKELLNKDGKFVSKIFMGIVFKEVVSIAKTVFKEVNLFKPKSSKKDSKENFIICKNLL